MIVIAKADFARACRSPFGELQKLNRGLVIGRANPNFFFDDTFPPMKGETPRGSLCLLCHAVLFC